MNNNNKIPSLLDFTCYWKEKMNKQKEIKKKHIIQYGYGCYVKSKAS